MQGRQECESHCQSAAKVFLSFFVGIWPYIASSRPRLLLVLPLPARHLYPSPRALPAVIATAGLNETSVS